ncbi:MAG: type II secretion system protein [Phormidium sp. BM_Day4_Bin.17]|nr:type II secretion system protein [Phormidium sp. BM_Day4_Bin.17]UCJ11196.1 MAG: type II secretion system GspH family protein [Phormidium sp. PBR-2020]
MVVIVMIGILMAIGAPSWLNFVNNQRVRNVTDAALQTMRRAQSRASTENRTWEASFQMTDNGVQGSAHPVDGGSAAWQLLAPEAGSLVAIAVEESTLTGDCQHGEYCIHFEDRGVIPHDWFVGAENNDSGTLARLAFVATDAGNEPPKRCIVAATILGSLRVDRCE